MSEIAFLADHPEAIPALAAAFREQWPGYYSRRGQAEVEAELHAWLNRENLPVGLVALEEGRPIGTVVLREEALAGHAYRPALGALYVVAADRRRGVGTHLVREGMNLGVKLGFSAIFSATGTAGAILERLDWSPIETVEHEGEPITFYRWPARLP